MKKIILLVICLCLVGNLYAEDTVVTINLKNYKYVLSQEDIMNMTKEELRDFGALMAIGQWFNLENETLEYLVNTLLPARILKEEVTHD